MKWKTVDGRICRLCLRSQSAESEGRRVQLRAKRLLIGQPGQKRGVSKRVSPPRKSEDRDSVQSGRVMSVLSSATARTERDEP